MKHYDNHLIYAAYLGVPVRELYNFSKKYTTECTKHAHLINLPKALDPSERPVMCSNCKFVTSLYHGYTPNYCSNCGAKFDKEEEE